MKIITKYTPRSNISSLISSESSKIERKSNLTTTNKRKYQGKLILWVKSNWLLLLIWILALVLRIISAIFSKGYIHPDEHYQSIEIAYSKIFGIGIIPWEFEDGARSWVYPGIVYIIFKIMIAFGATSIETLIIGVRLFSGIVSMISVVVAYYFGKLLYGRNAGLFATFFVGIWYDFIFWSTRTLADDLAMNFTFLATFLVYSGCANNKYTKQFSKKEKVSYFGNFIFAGFFIGIAYMFKFTAVIIIVPLFLFILLKKHWQGGLVFCVTIIVIIAIQGFIDVLTWGTFLHSSIVFFDYNILSNNSASHGTAPFYSYIGIFAYFYSAFALMYVLYLFLGSKKDQKTIFLLGTSLFLVLVFSFIAHKEYRFILPVLPLLSLIAANGMNKYPEFIKKKKIKNVIHCATVLLIVISSIITGLFDFSFRPKYNYCQSFEYISQQDEITQIYVVDDTIFDSPGYSYLGREISIDCINWQEIQLKYNQRQDSSICFVMTKGIYESESWIALTFQNNNITCVFSSIGTINHENNVEICVFQKITN